MRVSLFALALLLAACAETEAPVATGGTVAVPAAEETAGPEDAAVEAAVAGAAGPEETAAATADPSEIDPSDAGDDEVSLASWIGELAVTDDGTHFVEVPPVRARLEEAFGVEPGLLDKLVRLDQEPYYLVTPIESAGGMLATTFVPNGRLNPDPRSLHLLVSDDARHVFAVLTDSDGDTFYRASYDASADVLPAEAAAWMSRAANVDFPEMVRQSDAEVLGP